MRQVICGTVVMSDSASVGPKKTNPIRGLMEPAGAAEAVRGVPVRAYRGTGIPSASLSGQALPVLESHGQDGDPKRDSSRLGTHAHATRPPAGGTVIPVQGQSCKTNPIGSPAKPEAAERRGGVSAVVPEKREVSFYFIDPAASGRVWVGCGRGTDRRRVASRIGLRDDKGARLVTSAVGRLAKRAS
jgi:hypothetical protein